MSVEVWLRNRVSWCLDYKDIPAQVVDLDDVVPQLFELYEIEP